MTDLFTAPSNSDFVTEDEWEVHRFSPHTMLSYDKTVLVVADDVSSKAMQEAADYLWANEKTWAWTLDGGGLQLLGGFSLRLNKGPKPLITLRYIGNRVFVDHGFRLDVKSPAYATIYDAQNLLNMLNILSKAENLSKEWVMASDETMVWARPK